MNWPELISLLSLIFLVGLLVLIRGRRPYRRAKANPHWKHEPINVSSLALRLRRVRAGFKGHVSSRRFALAKRRHLVARARRMIETMQYFRRSHSHLAKEIRVTDGDVD